MRYYLRETTGKRIYKDKQKGKLGGRGGGGGEEKEKKIIILHF